MQPINTTSINKTRSSGDEEELLVPRRSAVLNFFLQEDLPMLAFLTRTERLSLAETCTTLCKAVETYSERNVQAIVDQHQVDNDFMDRVTAQGNLETTRQQPLVLPYRYMLSKAMFSHLYELRDNAENDDDGYNDGGLPPKTAVIAGGRLLIMPVNCRWKLWDLSTKECIKRTIPNDDHSWPPFDYILQENNNRLVLLMDKQVESWDLETGERRFSISLGEDFWNLVPISSANNKALALNSDRDVKIIDVDSGHVLADAQLQPWPPEYGCAICPEDVSKSDAFICNNNKWFVCVARAGPGPDGIFVFNLQSLQLVSHDKFPFDSILQATDDQATFAAFKDTRHNTERIVCIYTINNENGCLEPKSTFSMPDSYRELLVTTSHVYVEWRRRHLDGIAREVFEDPGTVLAYKIATGKLERRFVCPCNYLRSLTVWKGGNEIIATSTRDSGRTEVFAYCLAEPEQQKQQD